MRPFLKWAGGKYRILDRIAKSLPQGSRLVEPFVGSGAVFLNTDFDSYLLADSNPDLINCYQTLKEQGEDFVSYSKSLFSKKNNSKSAYLSLREEFNDTPVYADSILNQEYGIRRAALFIYLNRHGFNGLCRYNLSGEFNVPFGSYDKPYFPHEEMLHFYHKIQLAELYCCDFAETLGWLRESDVVYCDPPYVPASKTACFSTYTKNGEFGIREHKQLVEYLRSAAKIVRGVVVSNSKQASESLNYDGFSLTFFDVPRSISCVGTKRVKAQELIASIS